MDREAVQEIEAIISTAHCVKYPGDEGGGVPFVALPDGYKVHEVEHLLPAPIRMRAGVIVKDLASYVAYVDRFKGANSLAFAEDNYGAGKPQSICCVIDYHAPEAAAHRHHRCTLFQEVSEKWGRWTGISGKSLTQTSLAEFIEENAEDVVFPPAAELLEITRTFEATKGGAFRGGIRLSNGSYQLSYSESVEGSAGGGMITIPEKITLRIPVFKNGPLYEFQAWFRYRIEDGKLKLIIAVHRQRFIFDNAWNDIVQDSRAQSGVPVLIGQP